MLEPAVMLVTDVFLCEDGHAQERQMLPKVLETVRPKDVWIADRNFCTTNFLFGIAQRRGCFVIRQHGSTLSYELQGKRKLVGQCETGTVYEQAMRLTHPDGRTLKARRITLVLDDPTEDGDTEIHVVSNLPKRQFSGIAVVKGYRRRWKVENAFHELEQSLESEIRTLAYPKAALLAFCLALVTYNMLSVVKGSLAKVHGDVVPRERLSGYYLAEEISASYRGMMVALPPQTCDGSLPRFRRANWPKFWKRWPLPRILSSSARQPVGRKNRRPSELVVNVIIMYLPRGCSLPEPNQMLATKT